MTRKLPVVPSDCCDCGACCFSDDERYIAVFAVDQARMGDHALAFTQLVEGRRCMRFKGGRCTALREAAGRWHCAIYDVRPDSCRWLARGSGHCLADIARRRPTGRFNEIGYGAG